MNYHHLSIEERSCIRKYYVDGLSYREIARLVGRNVSTISREKMCIRDSYWETYALQNDIHEESVPVTAQGGVC